jgi:cytochrome c biogenesis protein CcdA
MDTGLIFLAGVLTIFAPCVLPVLPIILGSTFSKNKFNPVYLVIGLMISFTLSGFFISRYGSLIGLSADNIKLISGLLMLFFGLSYVINPINEFIQSKLSRLSQIGHLSSSKLDENNPIHILILGALLGLIWSPCSGPSLGIAIGLASQKESSFQGLQMMSVFSLGAGLSLLLFSYLSLTVSKNFFKKLVSWSKNFKNNFGYLLVVISCLIIFNLDKKIEFYLLKMTPQFLIDLSLRF